MNEAAIQRNAAHISQNNAALDRKLDESAAFTQAQADALYAPIGSSGAAPVIPPELVGFNDVALGANANDNPVAVNTDLTNTGTLVLSVTRTGARIRAGSYLFTFMGDVDATGERFNPQFAVAASGLVISETPPVYYRGTAGEEATIWSVPIYLQADTDLTFAARQGQYSTQIGGIGGAGTISDLRLQITPVGGIKGDTGAPGPANTASVAPYADVQLYPAATAPGIWPSRIWIHLGDKQTDKSLSSLSFGIAGMNKSISSPPTDGGWVGVDFSAADQRSALQNAGSATQRRGIVTMTFGDGSTHSHDVWLLTNNADAAPPVGVPVGSMMQYAGASAPGGWLICDGSAVSRTTYAALFTAIGTTYGAGDGRTTFALPDLRGRVAVGVDGRANRLASNDALGNSGGAESHILTVNEIPSHSHSLPWRHSGSHRRNGVAQGDSGNAAETGSIGGGQAHNNLPPYLIVNHIIKT